MSKRTKSADVCNAIAQGTLLFEQRGRAIWFKLVTKECTVCGPLNVRQDWSHLAPGVMPVIDQVSFSSGDCVSSTLLHGGCEQSSCWYQLLRQRLSPENIFGFCEKAGWFFCSYKSKPLELAKIEASAA